MATLTKHQIIEYLKKGELITNPCQKNGEFEVQPASYDLRAGIIIWKEHNPTTNENHLLTRTYVENLSFERQQTVDLQPRSGCFCNYI